MNSSANALRMYCISNLWIVLLVLVEYARKVRTNFSWHPFFPCENKFVFCKVSCFSFPVSTVESTGTLQWIFNWATHRCFRSSGDTCNLNYQYSVEILAIGDEEQTDRWVKRLEVQEYHSVHAAIKWVTCCWDKMEVSEVPVPAVTQGLCSGVQCEDTGSSWHWLDFCVWSLQYFAEKPGS